MSEREIYQRLATKHQDYARVLESDSTRRELSFTCAGCKERIPDAYFGCCALCLRRIAQALEEKARGE